MPISPLPAALFLIVAAEPAAPAAPAALRAEARALLAELVAVDSNPETGSTAPAIRAIVKRARAAGIPARDIRVLGPSTRKQNLVIRLRAAGPGRGGDRRPAVTPASPAPRPLLLLGHLDVVAARPEDWTVPPFKLTEKDGYLYGRGTSDMKGLVTAWFCAAARLHREGARLDRDVILAFTADEEDGPDNGVEWLLRRHPALIDAAFALNEGAGGELVDGRRRSLGVQTSEKIFQSFRLEATNPGGHSSLPVPENAIVRLAEALPKIHRHAFPPRLTDTNRAYFKALAAAESGALGADLRALAATPAGGPLDAALVARLAGKPYFNARLRTTCVPTRLAGGHADNALPQTATALVNCRILPGETPDGTRAALERVIGDPGVTVTAVGEPHDAPDSPLDPALFGAITAVAGRMWPGVPVTPVMTTGATDGRYLRAAGIPVYGVSGLFHDVNDVRAHGRDERIAAAAFDEMLAFTYELVRTLATAPGTGR